VPGRTNPGAAIAARLQASANAIRGNEEDVDRFVETFRRLTA
jgi:hypothetical protein